MAEILLHLDFRGRVLFASSAIETVLGYPREEIMNGETHWDVWHPDDLPTALEYMPRVLQGEIFPHLVHRMRHADGRYLTFETSAQPVLQPEGGSLGLVVICRNITQRREDESSGSGLQAKILEGPSDRNLAVMAGGIAHDFGNLLQGILASAELASMLVNSPESLERHLNSIIVASQRAGDLCKQLLAYSGRGNLERSHLELNGLVTEMLGLLRASISKKILLDPQLCKGELWIEANATQIRQVLMNLLINAAEAIGDRTGRTIVATREVDGNAELVVDDNGPGMAEDTLSRIFDPFFTTKFTGRGLGLASVRAIIEGHGGSIEVTSESGTGTQFRLLLPLVQPEAGVFEKLQAESEVPRRAANVLFVDDEELIRDTGGAVLQAAGFGVVLASDGRQAIRALEEEPRRFQCIVLDLTMPVMDGRETLLAVRSLDPRLPVVLCSGYHEHQIEDLLADDPHTVFLPKPYAPTHLLRKIGDLLAS